MRAALGLILLCCCAGAAAEQAVKQPPYTVHYAALPSVDVPPATARALGLRRSPRRAVLILNAQRTEDGRPLPTPIPATATGWTQNLIGHRQDLQFRTLHDQGAYYAIAEFEVLNQEWLSFSVQVLPEGAARPLALHFRQQFYTD